MTSAPRSAVLEITYSLSGISPPPAAPTLAPPTSPTFGRNGLIWFGVLICANIQTRFMHPPFGFALFYLRGIAPPSVKTTDIYWGAIPWVFLQLILVAIVIFWPESVTYWIEKGTGVDPSKINIEIQLPEMPPPLDLK